MGIITSNYSGELDGKTSVVVGEDTYRWGADRLLYDMVDFNVPTEGPSFTVNLKLSGSSWAVSVIRANINANFNITDATTGTSDAGRAYIDVLLAGGTGTSTITLKNAQVESLLAGNGVQKVTVGYWVNHMDLGGGNDHVVMTGGGEAENVILGTGNDTLTTDTGLMGTINGGGGADVVNLGKGGAEYVNLGRDADEIILSALADKELVVSLNGGERVLGSGKDSDTVNFTAFSARLTIDLNGASSVKTGSGEFHIRNFENAIGGRGKDTLVSNGEANILKGNGGADLFVFKTVKAATGDTILDFSQSQKDKIDLGGIDASTKSGGNQDFKFIGTAGFHNKAGELRYDKKGGDTFIHGDVNGDGKADFSIAIDANINLKASDFIL